MLRFTLVAVVLLGSLSPARADDAPDADDETQPAPPAPIAQPAPPPTAQPAPEPPKPRKKTPFDRGRVNLSAGAGSQSTFGAHYIVVGGGVGYFVLDGVELGLSGLHEFGSGPSISQLSPSLRYVVQPLVGHSPVIPYVGGFYKHWFVGGANADVDTVGGRAGLVYLSGTIILGLGVVYEHTVSACTMDCNSVYPDFTISLAL